MNDNEKQLDLRIRRTHKLLWDSLFELMTQSKQKYSTITINQICDRAMVHRTTFYKHFEDKDALLTFGFKRYGKMIAEIPVSDRLSKPFQVMEQFLHHEEIGKILETQMSDEQFISRAQYLSHETRKQEIEALNQLCKNYTLPNDLIIEFYSGAITSLSAWWFKNERSVSAAEMDQYLHQLINRDIFQFEEE
ncbi:MULTISPECIES: TetR/AcrR family transcriptional regulator [Bacillus cereus group]|uniref:TetR/AcrR family transcriptional regulator n=1 Tax=Bacillus cereus group TaxID=86661 RepID=UPI000BFDA692|nr:MULTISPECIES: TetR/AcrR family transcriptional regulator [Bacillus cereus group]MBJ8079327.1 TetR/AcrR family transcriptional regulator [Bacillus cereus group sp. N12]MDF9447819.1 TetR/AcrR family transcriptional regulator [Bacillus toyonensis]MDG1560524.1 TetR/AcrR family transcriptional regulator [Bacillus toyonensis]PHD48842.1 TetR family transcriptional regulator [Bacillus toyonensis]HDR7689167.1 TetR/AcrR family transcriptional regulator [Bacillus toyonensis]